MRGKDVSNTPVALSAISGTVRFEQLYAPEVDKDEVEIDAYLAGTIVNVVPP